MRPSLHILLGSRSYCERSCYSLLRLLLQLIPVLLDHPVRLSMRHQEAHIVDLCPSSLRASQIQRGSTSDGMTESRKSERGHSTTNRTPTTKHHGKKLNIRTVKWSTSVELSELEKTSDSIPNQASATSSLPRPFRCRQSLVPTPANAGSDIMVRYPWPEPAPFPPSWALTIAHTAIRHNSASNFGQFEDVSKPQCLRNHSIPKSMYQIQISGHSSLSVMTDRSQTTRVGQILIDPGIQLTNFSNLQGCRYKQILHLRAGQEHSH